MPEEPLETVEQESDPEGPSHFPCAQCGAELTFRPGTESLVCDHCGHVNRIEGDPEEVEEQDLLSALEVLEDASQTDAKTLLRCDSCGAEIEKPSTQTSFSCPWCGAPIVSQGQSVTRLRPGALLPFKVDHAQASQAYSAWLSKLWFAPNDIKKYARKKGRFRGLYMPFWTFDAEADTRYTGQRGEHYWVTVSYTTTDSNGNVQHRTRQERRTRWYPAAGLVHDEFDDVLVAASRAVPMKLLAKLEPWPLKEVLPYDDAYLAGLEAESYTVSLDDGLAQAKEIMKEGIRGTIRRDIGGDEQRIMSMRTQWDALKFKYILLPVWVASFRYRDKVYRFLVNARTGEVQGERPYSAWKITFLVVAILAVIAAVVVLAKSQGS